MSTSSDLLAQARTLATTDPHKPKQANLKRSISTRYYALFHFVCEESAKRLFGATQATKPFRDFARRAVAHTRLRDVSQEFAKDTPKAVLRSFWDRNAQPQRHDPWQIIRDPDFRMLSQAIFDLQTLRHTADYDFSSFFTRQEALDACDQADDAMQAWNRLKAGKPQALKLFAMAIFLWPGLSGRG